MTFDELCQGSSVHSVQERRANSAKLVPADYGERARRAFQPFAQEVEANAPFGDYGTMPHKSSMDSLGYDCIVIYRD